uniref:Uncharacterized protein n=1 Tax=Anguilla anguilla TaxID=7936 RepID=A0A0E9TX52_ANGAN
MKSLMCNDKNRYITNAVMQYNFILDGG